MCSFLPPPKGVLVPLTPEDVDNKRFSTARVMRQGYDMTEVDNFLDEVAAEMKRLHAELSELREKASDASAESTTVSQAAGSSSAAPAETGDGNQAEATADDSTSSDGDSTSSGDDSAQGTHAEAGSTEGDTSAQRAPAGDADPTSTPSAPSAAAEEELAEGETEVARVSGTGGELLRVATTEDAAAAAARMLELAGRNAEELVSDARSQADRIVAEAAGRAEELDGDTEQRRAQLVADLERDHQELKDEVEDLRAFEREYRAQLRNYFQQQLEALDAQGGGVTLAEDLHEDEGEIGSRLRSILAEEEGDSTDEGGSDPAASGPDTDTRDGSPEGDAGEKSGDESAEGTRPTP